MKENIFFEGWKQWSSAAGKLGFTAPERRGLSRWPRAAFERNKGEITAARDLGELEMVEVAVYQTAMAAPPYYPL
ncbi:hypothetical protein OIU77_003414 [Salix suchowensis]|uniref:Uncharacterized protein n=1 Tax=Salix suchowensis TaxID=1278906 RepID=A0ABQ9B1P1_9ROSI|nr:hypothetical protein OIU77_003414 [Salix suchowensis]